MMEIEMVLIFWNVIFFQNDSKFQNSLKNSIFFIIFVIRNLG